MPILPLTEDQTGTARMTTMDAHWGGMDRLLHAYPTGSDVALCGVRQSQHHSAFATERCPTCEQEAGRKNWVQR